jgi:hypothetical protein
VGAALAAFCALALAGCGAEPTKKANADGDVLAKVSPAEQANAAAEIDADEAARDARIPAKYPRAPVTGLCPPGRDEQLCQTTRAQFEQKDWPRAWGGDYQGQRNVAYCSYTGCDGAVQVNKVLACAWRQVIQVSGDPDVGQLDLDQQKTECGALDDAGRAAARAQAQQIFTAVYKRPMPAA